MNQDTIFALASGRPPAAIAIIRISGPQAHMAGAALAGDLPEARRAALRPLRWAGELLDECLVLRFDGPLSATGEDVVEFHCHGGRAVVDAVLAALATIKGLRMADPGEFTRRGFHNGRMDLTEAEGLADLLEAETQSQRRAALASSSGGLRRQVEEWQAQLLALSARAEAAIDYDEEDDLGTDPRLAQDCAALAEELDQWLARPTVYPLRDGIKVVLAGPPNSGKSSLLNAIVGSEKAIVTDIAGTTRDEIEVPVAVGGVPLLFTDTAGIRETAEPVERIGVDRARAAVDRAEILLWLGEPAEAPAHDRLVLVHSRADLESRGPAPPGSIAASSVSGEGIAVLMGEVCKLAQGLLPAEGSVALNRRQHEAVSHAADAVRGVDSDILLTAESLRIARLAFQRLTGRAGVEDMLDTLFGRFCLGK